MPGSMHTTQQRCGHLDEQCPHARVSFEAGTQTQSLDAGPIDALRVAGASSPQVAAHVVLPSVVPQCIGLLLYRFDVNVRSSLVLGLVGAGGIGFLINQAIALFDFDQMMTYILMVLVLVVAVDVASGMVRRRLAE